VCDQRRARRCLVRSGEEDGGLESGEGWLPGRRPSTATAICLAAPTRLEVTVAPETDLDR
jgi:hypothetical protein